MHSKIKLLCSIIIIVLIIVKKTDGKIPLSQKQIIDNIYSTINKIAQSTLHFITQINLNTTITDQCKDVLNYTITNKKINKIVFEKFILHSGKMSNDISSYKDCFYNYGSFTEEEDINYIKNNITYVIFIYNTFKSENPFTKEKINLSKKTIVGFCLPKGCSNKDYQKLFEIVATKIIEFSDDEQDEDINYYEKLSAYSLYEKEAIDLVYLIHFIPFCVLIIIFSFSLFPNIICCKRSKVNNVQQKNNFFFRIKKCFNLGENCEEISKKKISLYDTNLFEEGGLSIFYGILSIGIVQVIVGMIFETVFLSPMTTSRRYLISIFTKPQISYIIHAQRFGKKLCFSISSVTLVYKFLSFLDNEIDHKENFTTSKPLLDETSNLVSNLSSNKSYRKFHKYLQWKKSFLLFIAKNIYKYIIFWLFVLIYKYSFYYVVNLLFNPGPFWIYFNNAILSKFSLITLFGVEFLSSYETLVNYAKSNPFKIIINETNAYIIITILIFWFYKHNYHLDIFIFGLIIFLFGGKFYLFNQWFIHKDMRLSPAKSFMFSVNNYLLNSSLYNFSFFSIGIMVGLVNYCIQKENLKKSKKRFLSIPFIIISHFQQKKKHSYLNVCFCVFILVFISFSYFFLFSICKFFKGNLTIEKFLHNYYINLFYLYDNEIGLICLYYIIFYFFYSSDSLIITLLKNPFCNFISRPYYTTMLTCGIVCYYILYQSDTKVTIDNSGIFFYIIIGTFFVFLTSIICFILIEVPFKRITKMITSNFDDKIKKNDILSSNASLTDNNKEKTETSDKINSRYYNRISDDASSESKEHSESEEKNSNDNDIHYNYAYDNNPMDMLMHHNGTVNDFN